MNEAERVHKILTDLNLPDGQWTLTGSGVLILHGITAEQRGKPMGDLDIFVSTMLWFKLYSREHEVWAKDGGHPRPIFWDLFLTSGSDPKRRCDPPYLYETFYGLEVNIFSSWRVRGIGDIDVNNWIHNAQKVAGWPCVPLQYLYDWKDKVGRDKDAVDVEILRSRVPFP